MTDPATWASVGALLADFTHAWDAGDEDALVALFVEDGVFASPGGRYTGTDELRAMTAAYQRFDDAADTLHVVSSPQVTSRADGTLVVRSYCHALTCVGERIEVSMMSEYVDVMRRDSKGELRFVSREIVRLWPPELRSLNLTRSDETPSGH